MTRRPGRGRWSLVLTGVVAVVLSGCSGGSTSAAGAPAAGGSAASAGSGGTAAAAASGGATPGAVPGTAGSGKAATAAGPAASGGTKGASAGTPAPANRVPVPAQTVKVGDPGCQPDKAGAEIGLATSALDHYVLAPARKGSLRGSGTAAAVARLHAAAAVHFTRAHLSTARSAVLACGDRTPVITATTAQIAALAPLAASLDRSAVPTTTALSRATSGDRAVLTAAGQAGITVHAVVPTVPQLQA